MRLVRLRAPGGLENLKLVEEDHPRPRPGELLIRIRASSLNFHDDMVVLGKIPCADGRIPMSDGAGEVIAVGDDVDEFKVADNVVSTFWPYWLGGEMTPATRREILLTAMPASTCACRRTPSPRHRQVTRTRRRQRSPARESPRGEAWWCAAR